MASSQPLIRNLMSSPELITDFEEMARERAAGIVSLQLAWSGSLKKLASLRLNATYTRAVATGCLAPRDVDLMTSLLSSSDDAEALFEENLKSSAYGLADFLEGVIALCRYLDRDRRQTTLEMVLGYVRCCEDGMDDYPSANSLREVVEAMLEEHGFTGED